MNFNSDNAPRQGRRPGVRNRLAHGFLVDLHKEWQAHGAEVLKIMRVERPVEFAKLVAGTLPREFNITHDTEIEALTDDQLDDLVVRIRALRTGGAGAQSAGDQGGEDAAGPVIN